MSNCKCSICGEEINGFGNNPYPVRTGENDRCCDECNDVFVIPSRIAMVKLDPKQYKKSAEILNNTKYDRLVEIFFNYDED